MKNLLLCLTLTLCVMSCNKKESEVRSYKTKNQKTKLKNEHFHIWKRVPTKSIKRVTV